MKPFRILDFKTCFITLIVNDKRHHGSNVVILLGGQKCRFLFVRHEGDLNAVNPTQVFTVNSIKQNFDVDYLITRPSRKLDFASPLLSLVD